MKPVKVMLVCLVAILGLSTLAYAEVPKMINYQGKITTPQGALINDTVSMTFTIYNAPTDGAVLWTEAQPQVIVEFGVFSVLLGSVNPIPDSVFDGNVRYLALAVGSDAVMMPLRPIVSVGYAYHSATADTAYFAMPDADWVIKGDTIYHLNGYVGIGTSTTTGVLHINTPDAQENIILSRTGVPDTFQIRVSRDSTNNKGVLFISNDSSDFEGIAVREDGYIGIGVRSAQARLHLRISGTTLTGEATPTNEGPVFQNSSPGSNSAVDIIGPNDGGSVLVFGDTDDRDVASIFYSHLDNSMGFQTNDVYQMRISNNGNVGIGTDSPAYKLDVEGYVQAYGYYTGDIVFQKNKEKLWRMFEDEDGLYLENLKTGRVYRFVLQEVEKK